MSDTHISSADPYERKRIKVLDTHMAYIDVGKGDPIVFLHGNPTSSYLWRNIIPHLEGLGRCLAPDLIGMGDSGKLDSSFYTFADHYMHLEAWFDAVDATQNLILVVHDWGSALGFNYAYQHRQQGHVQGIAYMEGMVQPIKAWDDWPEMARSAFMGLRAPDKGEELALERNFFVERILPSSIMRKLTDEEMDVYRKPYLNAGEDRRPTLTWPRQIPIEGEPTDVHAMMANYSNWLATNEDLPKLFINADPGAILIGPQREFCRSWPNQTEITVPGIHFIQEDSPHTIGEAVAEFVKGIRDEG